MRHRRTSEPVSGFRSAVLAVGEERITPCVLATDEAVRMPDASGQRFIDEYLLMSGLEPPPAQVPLLDSHKRDSVGNMLGSLRDLSVTPRKGDQRGELRAKVYWGEDEEAERAYQYYRGGHLKDISVGYLVLRAERLEIGESKVYEGRRINGPAVVVTSWRVKEGSVVPIGADAHARLRADQQRKRAMDQALRDQLVALGMPEELDDAAAIGWLLAKLKGTEGAAAAPPPEEGAEGAMGDKGKGDKGRQAPKLYDPEELAKMVRSIADEQEKQRADQRSARKKSVDALCEMAGIEARAEWYELDDEAARKAIKEARDAKRSSPDLGLAVRFGDYQPRERGVDAVRYALVSSALRSVGAKPETADKQLKSFQWGQRSYGQEHEAAMNRARDAAETEFRGAGPFELARQCCEIDGYNVRGMTRAEIAQTALGFAPAGLRTRGGAAIHVTASFPQVTLDAINKSMMSGYDEAPSTWEGPIRRGASVADFKSIHRIVLSAVGNLPVWVDNEPPQQAKIGDGKESYAVEARSIELSYSWRLLINDDMDVLSRTPQQLGVSAARTVNAVAWAKVTENPVMRDGQTFFLTTPAGNRFRSNQTTGVAPPSVAAIQVLANKMAQMRGENLPGNIESDAILGLRPFYLIGPTALETTIMQLIRSTQDPAFTGSNVYNPAQRYEAVIEPLLDANSAVAWYMAADGRLIDGFEVTFLQGFESPQTDSYQDPKTKSLCYTIVQVFAAAALEWRGWQKHVGA